MVLVHQEWVQPQQCKRARPSTRARKGMTRTHTYWYTCAITQHAHAGTVADAGAPGTEGGISRTNSKLSSTAPNLAGSRGAFQQRVLLGLQGLHHLLHVHLLALVRLKGKADGDAPCGQLATAPSHLHHRRGVDGDPAAAAAGTPGITRAHRPGAAKHLHNKTGGRGQGRERGQARGWCRRLGDPSPSPPTSNLHEVRNSSQPCSPRHLTRSSLDGGSSECERLCGRASACGVWWT
jgi:hypothetical protein